MKRVQRWPAASVVVLVGLSVAACGSPQTKRTATEAGVRSAMVSGEEPMRVQPCALRKNRYGEGFTWRWAR